MESFLFDINNKSIKPKWRSLICNFGVLNINGNDISGQSTALTDSCYVQLVESSFEGALKIYFHLYDRFRNQISAQDFYKTNVSCSAFSSTDTSKYKKIIIYLSGIFCIKLFHIPILVYKL